MGFRSRSSRAQSAQVVSGLNSVDTNWSAFNYYISRKQLADPIMFLPIDDNLHR